MMSITKSIVPAEIVRRGLYHKVIFAWYKKEREQKKNLDLSMKPLNFSQSL